MISLTVVPEESYKKLGLDYLLIYAMKRIREGGEDITFERLVYECFTLFPGRFGFVRYPQWPDATRINKSWLRCRTDNGWIIGSVQEGFRLTTKGEDVAREVEQKLGGASQGIVRSAQKVRGKEEAALRYLRNSASFRRWVEQPKEIDDFQISERELRTLLNCTAETPRRIIRQNLHYYMSMAELARDQAVSDFLRACSRAQHHFLEQSMGERK